MSFSTSNITFRLPPNIVTAFFSLNSISASNSSSLMSVVGFLAPPTSVFLDASLVIISRSPLRILDPGFASRYCFKRRLLNPAVPPKASIAPSSNSAVWGMLFPPERGRLLRRSIASSSILCISSSASFLFLHLTHTYSNVSPLPVGL